MSVIILNSPNLGTELLSKLVLWSPTVWDRIPYLLFAL